MDLDQKWDEYLQWQKLELEAFKAGNRERMKDAQNAMRQIERDFEKRGYFVEPRRPGLIERVMRYFR